MKKIIFGITGLTLGGAERVLVDLSNELSRKYDVTIFTLYGNGELEGQLYTNVKHISLYKEKYNDLSNFKKKIIPLKILFMKKFIYRKYIKKDYDVEVAFLEGPITRLFSVKNKKVKKIAWVHNDISLVFGNGFKAKIKKKTDRKTYSKYDEIIFVSRDNLKKFRKQYPDLRNRDLQPVKKDVIYNYLNKDLVIQKSNEVLDIQFDSENLNFVTVARLVPQKAIDRLIDVHTKLIKNGFNHNFYVIGEGPEQKMLEDKIKQNNVQETFHLLGKKINPYPYMNAADYFCLLSQFEGYGMVLEEAKILGKEILITDTAAREAVENYKQAYIVPNNFDGIYETLKNVISKGKNKSNENVSNEYDNSKIIEKVEKLFVQ